MGANEEGEGLVMHGHGRAFFFGGRRGEQATPVPRRVVEGEGLVTLFSTSSLRNLGKYRTFPTFFLEKGSKRRGERVWVWTRPSSLRKRSGLLTLSSTKDEALAMTIDLEPLT